MIHSHSYPRAALAGNPSDGYFGKTLAYTFNNFKAEVCLKPAASESAMPANLKIFDCPGTDKMLNADMTHWAEGIRLIPGAIRCFAEYCREHGIQPDTEPYTLGFRSDIPSQVGLASSSAIVHACYQALMSHHGVDIAAPFLANEILRAEVEILKIQGGLQDRVTQVYRGMVFMDFKQALMRRRRYGHYETIEPPPGLRLYVAYRPELAEFSGILHGQLRDRWNRNDRDLKQAMERCAGFAARARQQLMQGDFSALARTINAGFDQRHAVIPSSPGNLEMIQLARSVGASANQAGSGGAITGTCADENMFDDLKRLLTSRGIEVIQPEVTRP